jgi:hypothetical protein
MADFRRFGARHGPDLLLAGRGCRFALPLTSSGYQLRPIAMPDMSYDCRHDDHAAREIGDGWCVAEADPHPCDGRRRFQRVIGAFSVAETI